LEIFENQGHKLPMKNVLQGSSVAQKRLLKENRPAQLIETNRILTSAL